MNLIVRLKCHHVEIGIGFVRLRPKGFNVEHGMLSNRASQSSGFRNIGATRASASQTPVAFIQQRGLCMAVM